MCGRARYAERAASKILQLTEIRKDSDHSNPRQKVKAEEKDVTLPGTKENTLVNRVIQNLSPGMEVPVLVRNEAGELEIALMKWGLIPSYARPSDPKHADHYKLFNKRIEAFGESQRYFDRLASRRRCVVLLDGFFEWTGMPGSKQPYYVFADSDTQPLVMPGIFEELQCEDGSVLRSFAIVTGEPCASFRRLHDRQPVLLSEPQMQLWLQPQLSAYDLLQQFRENYRTQLLRFHPVTKRMTVAAYQAADCAVAVEPPRQDITAFFSPKAAQKDKKGAGLGQKREAGEGDDTGSERKAAKLELA